MLIFASFICLFAFGNADLLSGISKCKIPDDECLKKSTQAFLPKFIEGLPEVNVKTLDPYKMEKLDLSNGNLKFVLTDIIAHGVKDCKVTKMSINDLNMSASVSCALEVYGSYVMDGKMLVLSVQGSGPAHLSLPGVEVSSDVALTDYVGSDGKKHWKVKSFTHKYKLFKKAIIRMENMFNGNKALSQAVNDLFDSSPNEVMDEFMPTILQTIIGVIAKNVNNFFKAYAIEDLTLQ